MSYTICAIVQHGRLQYEAVLFMESLARSNPDFNGRVMFLEPAQNELWTGPTAIDDDIRAFLVERGAEVVSFECQHFGERYPHGNKIEALTAVPTDQPFVFFDTDTLFTGDLEQVAFDFARPSASMRRTNSWPNLNVTDYSGGQIWAALYDKFDLGFETSQDKSKPADDWQRYLYFNAGWFFGQNAAKFHKRFLDYAVQIETNPPTELTSQSLNPWLDQIALPLVIHALGGGRASAAHGYLDGSVSYHYRTLPLLFAKGSDVQVSAVTEIANDPRVKSLLSKYDPMAQVLYNGKGSDIRALAKAYVDAEEGTLRRALRDAGLWFR